MVQFPRIVLSEPEATMAMTVTIRLKGTDETFYAWQHREANRTLNLMLHAVNSHCAGDLMDNGLSNRRFANHGYNHRWPTFYSNKILQFSFEMLRKCCLLRFASDFIRMWHSQSIMLSAESE